MPPNRKQVDITDIYEEIEQLANAASVSASGMARLLINLGIAKYRNIGTSPSEAIASFNAWGEDGVAEVTRSGLNWLLEQDSGGDRTGQLAIAFILSQLGQSKIDGADLAILASALKVDGEKLQSLLNKRGKQRNGS